MDITYRRATIDDIPALIRLRMALHKDRHGDVDDGKRKEMQQQLASYLLSSLTSGTYNAWVAYDAEIPAGMGAFVTQEICSIMDWPFVRIAYVCNMYTLHDYRGNGICTQIVKLMMGAAKEMNITKLELHASPYGEPIYRKLGFEQHAEPYLVYKL